MIEQQVRDRIAASADEVGCAPVPLADIRAAGRALARRRTRVRVAGSAAVVVGVGAAAVVAGPGQGPGGDTPMPATQQSRATQSAQPSTATPDTSQTPRRRGGGASLTLAQLRACLDDLGEERVADLVEALRLPRDVLRACGERGTGAR